jgi:putative peptide zinc metalloprotease protein
MNILEAFELSIPEVAARRPSLPRVEPRLLASEQVQDGKAVVVVHLPGGQGLYRISPEEWRAFQLMNGERSYAEIAEACQAQGLEWTEESLRELVEQAKDSELLHKTPAERNITLKQKTASERRKIRKLKFGNLSEVEIGHWDPDKFLTWLYPKVKFMFTWWFFFASLIGFAVMLFLCLDRWGDLWRDTFEFFNYFGKGWSDLVQFYFLFGLMVFVHECAHGIACKHFGGNVHKMGFMLMFLMPTFFCDVTETWIYAGRWPRIATMAAGIWVDLILCVPATIVWWATPTGMPIHDFAYKIMLLTGIVISLMQLNPLMRLDGYFIFSELIEISDLMEDSGRLLSSWVRRNIFRLPVEVEYVPPRRRIFYFAYALLSETYGIFLLVLVVVLAYNILRSFSPEWAFIPAFWLGFVIFRSKIVNFMKLLKLSYLDHKELWKRHLASWRMAAVAVAVVLMFLPVWRETVEGRMMVQPVKRTVLHAEVPGQVQAVLAEEGERVERGTPIVRLTNLSLQSEAAETQVQLQMASARATQSQLTYTDFAGAEREKEHLLEQSRTMADQLKNLEVVSPMSGVVLTSYLRNLQGRYLPAGAEIAEIADFSAMRAQVYVPEFTMRDVRVGAPARLLPEGMLQSLAGTVVSVSPAAAPIPAGLTEDSDYVGIRPPQYYLAVVSFAPRSLLPDGLTGTAKIFVRRRSLMGFGWQFLRDMTARKFW